MTLDEDQVEDIYVVGTGTDQKEWVRDHWEPLTTAGNGVVLLRCINYDVPTRSCLAYDSRPPVCSEFPYDQIGVMDHESGAQLVCGYQQEAGRRVLPLVQITGRDNRTSA